MIFFFPRDIEREVVNLLLYMIINKKFSLLIAWDKKNFPRAPKNKFFFNKFIKINKFLGSLNQKLPQISMKFLEIRFIGLIF